MKKIMGVGLVVFLSLGILSGCSLLSGNANGLVTYGNEQQINTVINNNKSDIKEKDTYKVKLTTVEGKKVLVLDKKTGEEFVKKELLKKVENDNTKAIDKLPTIKANQGILFAKEKIGAAKINETSLKYEGNSIIGDSRVYVDMFAIVDDTAYHNIEGEEKSVAILKFNKDPKDTVMNAKKDTEAVQLVKIN